MVVEKPERGLISCVWILCGAAVDDGTAVLGSASTLCDELSSPESRMNGPFNPRWPADCTCFSMCGMHDVSDFVCRIPAFVGSDSPWMGYLEQVYGERPEAPFPLHELNFFYHRDVTWPASVEWPMASCVRLHTQHKPVPDPTVKKCSVEQCSRWYDERPSASRRHTVVIFPNGPLTKGHPSRGTAFYEFFPNFFNISHPFDKDYSSESSLIHAMQATHGHLAWPNGSWVEVMHMNERVMPALLFAYNGGQMREGEHNYGCWFYPTRGSGIWINIGRSWLMSTKDEKVVLHGMVDSMKARRNDNGPTRAFKHGRRTFEDFPAEAAYLGFDAVQVLAKSLAPRRMEVMAELVILLNPYCMARNESGLGPLRTCTPFLDLRRGLKPHRGVPCACEEAASFSLNCAANSTNSTAPTRAPYDLGEGRVAWFGPI